MGHGAASRPVRHIPNGRILRRCFCRESHEAEMDDFRSEAC